MAAPETKPASDRDLASISEARTLARAARQAQTALAELGDERARLDTIVQQMPAGLLIAEAPSGKLIRGNEQLEHILRRQFIPSPDLAAYADWQFSSLSGVALLPEEFPLARSILHGERGVNESLGVARGDGTRGFVTVSSTPILDRDGRILAAVATVYDVSEQRRSEESLRFLAEATSILASSLDYEDTLPTIAKLAVPFLADACIIDVVEVDGNVRRVAAVHREASRAGAVQAALRATPDPTALHHPVVRALRTGMSDLFPEYPPPVRSAGPPGRPCRIHLTQTRLHLERRHRDPSSFDVAGLVTRTEGFSGAELEGVIVGALYRAFAAEKELDPGDGYRRIFNQSWWCGYGPSDDPELVVCALIENGGHGGSAAAPASLKVFEEFFGKEAVLQGPIHSD